MLAKAIALFSIIIFTITLCCICIAGLILR